MRIHIKDISTEEIKDYQTGIANGIYELGGPKKGGKIGLYSVQTESYETTDLLRRIPGSVSRFTRIG